MPARFDSDCRGFEFKEIDMFNDSSTQQRHDEMERNAYNAAFNELGFRWYWDRDTYEQLLQRSENAGERIRQYLETHQPHLLRAYDATFLVAAIEEKKAEHRKQARSDSNLVAGYFDWAQMPGCELGA